MTERAENIIDRLANLLPGYQSFKDKEARRDTDARVRERVATVLDDNKVKLDEMIRAMTDEGRLDVISGLDRLKRQVGSCADGIRHVAHGDSGLMDDRVIGELELDRIHDHDLGLLEQAQQLTTAFADLDAAGTPDALPELTKTVESMRQAIDRREQLLQEVF
ncbi:MAG: hypothetical protein AAF533_05330 [Acidobacteriota bacterium]